MQRNRRVIRKDPLILKEATDNIFKAIKLRDADRFGILKISIKQDYTEPLAKEILPHIFDETLTFSRKGKSDITGIDDNGNHYNIEIKTSMESGFTRLGEKDIAADYLIWIDFGTFFTKQGSQKEIKIYVSKNVKSYFEKYLEPYSIKDQQKILHCMRIERYFKILEDNIETKTFDLYSFIYN